MVDHTHSLKSTIRFVNGYHHLFSLAAANGVVVWCWRLRRGNGRGTLTKVMIGEPELPVTVRFVVTSVESPLQAINDESNFRLEF